MTAVYDYNAQKVRSLVISTNPFQENDLSFKKGDRIQVLQKMENGWWIGLYQAKIGYFPSNYVAFVN